jgi:hypothetical protein
MGRPLIAVVLLTLCGVSLAAAQGEIPPTFRDLPLMIRDEVGARWTGMGGACMALVDDGSAAYWNPAGLGKIRRIEILGGMNWRDNTIDTEYYGNPNTSSVSRTRFENLAVSYPFPTYRGSFVIAGSVHRQTSYEKYLNRWAEVGDDFYQDIETSDVALTSWSGAFAIQLSQSMFLGAEAHFNTGDMKMKETYFPWGACPEPGGIFEQTSELGGYGGKLGFVYVPHPMASMGMVLKLPERISVKGSEVITSNHDPCEDLYQSIRYDIDFPYTFGFGLGFTPYDFTIGFDLVHTDWRQLRFPGKVRDEETGRYYYDATTDLRVGVEYSIPIENPVRVWAGYAYVPLELNLFIIEKNRSRFSLGAGILVEESLTIDFTWQRTTSERKHLESFYSEKQEIDRAIITLAFRF